MEMGQLADELMMDEVEVDEEMGMIDKVAIFNLLYVFLQIVW